MTDFIHPKVVNAYMEYMRRTNPGRGIGLEEFAKDWDAKSAKSTDQKEQ